jgi:hypothetical protein
MKNLINIIFLFASITIFSQKSLDATIITKNGENITGKMRVYTELFDKNSVDLRSFIRNVVLVDENGKKIQKIKAKDIESLKYSNFNGDTLTFLNNGNMLKLEAYVGKKVKWYREFRIHLYDGSLQADELFIDQNNKEYRVGLFNSLKNKLKELTKSKPELVSEIDNVKYNRESILNILQKYDEE